MPWLEVSPVSQRIHFYNLWKSNSHSMSDLCSLFGISRKTGYKWVQRGASGGEEALHDQSKRPKTSPCKTSQWIESAVLKVRKAHPSWGGRKIRRVLTNRGYAGLPSVSTITEILRRNGQLTEDRSQRDAGIRFEHAQPNALWQMDFKGHFALNQGGNRCHPLTVLDDHSRYSLVLKACEAETRTTVQSALQEAFERYGIPDRMTMDNGSPWGHKGSAGGYTRLTVWLLDLGIGVSHSRPYHPQTQGKDERFHRTLKAEVLSRQDFRSLRHCQNSFDQWQAIYNFVRPHDALQLEVPASRYRISTRKYVGIRPFDEYSEEEPLRKVNRSGAISYRSQKCFLGEAFAGRYVAIKRTLEPTKFEIYYRHQRIAKLVLER